MDRSLRDEKNRRKTIKEIKLRYYLIKLKYCFVSFVWL